MTRANSRSSSGTTRLALPVAGGAEPGSVPARRAAGGSAPRARPAPVPALRTSTQLLDGLPHGNESPATREPGEGHRRRGASGGGELEKARQPRRASRRNWVMTSRESSETASKSAVQG